MHWDTPRWESRVLPGRVEWEMLSGPWEVTLRLPGSTRPVSECTARQNLHSHPVSGWMNQTPVIWATHWMKIPTNWDSAILAMWQPWKQNRPIQVDWSVSISGSDITKWRISILIPLQRGTMQSLHLWTTLSTMQTGTTGVTFMRNLPGRPISFYMIPTRRSTGTISGMPGMVRARGKALTGKDRSMNTPSV